PGALWYAASANLRLRCAVLEGSAVTTGCQQQEEMHHGGLAQHVDGVDPGRRRDRRRRNPDPEKRAAGRRQDRQGRNDLPGGVAEHGPEEGQGEEGGRQREVREVLRRRRQELRARRRQDRRRRGQLAAQRDLRRQEGGRRREEAADGPEEECQVGQPQVRQAVQRVHEKV